MRIVLRDGGACNTVIYLQMNWHGDFYRWYSANGDSFTVQQGDEWGVWLSAPLACNAPHAYHWNAQWGYMFFVDFSAPNGADPQLGLYFVHGRWYSPDTGMFLSPNEKGEYLYGSGDDAINWVWFSAGLQCQFWNNFYLGLVEYQIPGATYKCQDLEGNVYFFSGQMLGQSLSTLEGGLEFLLGGGLTLGGGGITIGTGGTLSVVSVPTALGGLGLVGHGGAILIRNTLNPPILYAKGNSGPEKMPPGSPERHHLLPKQFKPEFERAGLNIENYVKELPRDFHKDIHGKGGGESWINSWNKRWECTEPQKLDSSQSNILEYTAHRKGFPWASTHSTRPSSKLRSSLNHFKARRAKRKSVARTMLLTN